MTEDAETTRYEAERTRAIEIAPHAMTRTYIGSPPKLRGDAERMVTALIEAGWTPPASSGPVEVEEYDEWCLTGQPEGDHPFHCATEHTAEKVERLKLIWSAIESGHPNYRWTNAVLERRHVRVERTGWVATEPED